jgi:hypothetical protein
MQPWTKAIVFSAISAALILLLYLTPSPEAGFAGANFGYNISFFFPVLLASFVFWYLALQCYVALLRQPSPQIATQDFVASYLIAALYTAGDVDRSRLISATRSRLTNR